MIDASDEPAWWASAMAGAVTGDLARVSGVCSALADCVAGAGVATWSSIYPVDVVKSMVQTLPEGDTQAAATRTH